VVLSFGHSNRRVGVDPVQVLGVPKAEQIGFPAEACRACQRTAETADSVCKATSVLVASGISGAGTSFLMSPGKRKSSGETDLLALMPLQPVIRAKDNQSTGPHQSRLWDKRNALFIGHFAERLLSGYDEWESISMGFM